MTPHTKWLYGIDGCRGGWLLAKSMADLGGLSFSMTSDLRTLFTEGGGDSVIAVDIPIGLPDHEPRACDIESRRELGQPRGSSVFPAPARNALDANIYADAVRVNRDALGVGMSKQTFCIIRKIREVDALMNIVMQRYIREAHPEVTFERLNGVAMAHNKKTPQGRVERIAVLRKMGIDISEVWLAEEREKLGAKCVALDDLVDALACLITAFHIHAGRSQSLGRIDQKDTKGLLMEIVTCCPTVQVASA